MGQAAYDQYLDLSISSRPVVRVSIRGIMVNGRKMCFLNTHRLLVDLESIKALHVSLHKFGKNTFHVQDNLYMLLFVHVISLHMTRPSTLC